MRVMEAGGLEQAGMKPKPCRRHAGARNYKGGRVAAMGSVNTNACSLHCQPPTRHDASGHTNANHPPLDCRSLSARQLDCSGENHGENDCGEMTVWLEMTPC